MNIPVEHELLAFARAVQEMRGQQRRFFKAGRGTAGRQDAYNRSLSAEKVVDEMVRKILRGQAMLEGIDEQPEDVRPVPDDQAGVGVSEEQTR